MSAHENAPPPPTLAQLLAAATERLASVTETPRLDAEILLAHALGISRSQLLARLRDRTDTARFEALVERRLAYEPLAYILGEWEFFSLTLDTPPPLLVPRPETEHLVECVLEHVHERAAKVLDLCTGTGCVAVAVAANAPRVHVTATDINPFALETARRNASRYSVGDRVEVRLGDLFDALVPEDGPFDVICSNPPYVEEDAWPALSPVIRLHEDRRALVAGKDGLAVIRAIVERTPRHLRADGLLAIEIGMGQREAVEALLVRHGYAGIAFQRDLAGIDRVAAARRS